MIVEIVERDQPPTRALLPADRFIRNGDIRNACLHPTHTSYRMSHGDLLTFNLAHCL